jgi:hypothetical protein
LNLETETDSEPQVPDLAAEARREAVRVALNRVRLTEDADPDLIVESFAAFVSIADDGSVLLGDEPLSAASLAAVLPKQFLGTRGVGGSGRRSPREARNDPPRPEPQPFEDRGTLRPDGVFVMKSDGRAGESQAAADWRRMTGRAL